MRFRKSGLSTNDKGYRSPAVNMTRANVIYLRRASVLGYVVLVSSYLQ